MFVQQSICIYTYFLGFERKSITCALDFSTRPNDKVYLVDCLLIVDEFGPFMYASVCAPLANIRMHFEMHSVVRLWNASSIKLHNLHASVENTQLTKCERTSETEHESKPESYIQN